MIFVDKFLIFISWSVGLSSTFNLTCVEHEYQELINYEKNCLRGDRKTERLFQSGDRSQDLNLGPL